MNHPLIGILAVLAALATGCDRRPAAPARPSDAPSATTSAATDSTRWPHVGSDLKPDPAVVWGALENGLRYAILPHAEPPGRLSLRLYVEAGSLHESDAQRGLAHFLEHMAFNGTEHFPAGEMVAYFQRLGMGFGADTNAHTSFRETVYKLELPPAAGGTAPNPKTLGDGLRLLRDMAGQMNLEPAEIDKERGIILSEKLARDTVEFRIFEEGLKFQLPDHKISQRLPIGVAETITQASRDAFVDFYRRYYTPDRMIFVAVGAVEPADLAGQIAATFGTLAPGEKTPDPDFGAVTIGRGVSAKAHLEKEAGYASISFGVSLPFQPRIDTSESRLVDLKRELAARMLARRFEIIARQKDAPVLQAQVQIEPFLRLIDAAQLDVTAQSNRWNDAVALTARELRRAMKFGFTVAELAEARATLLAEVTNAARMADTRKSRDLGDHLVRVLGDGKVFTHPADDLPRISAALEKIIPADCHQALQQSFGSKDLSVFAAGNLVRPENGETLEAALHRGMNDPIEAPVETGEAVFGYTSFGAPGAESSRTDVADLGITQVVFANNVRVNLKPTDFQKDQVLVRASVGSGKLSLPSDKPGLELFAEQTFELGGLGKHSIDELRRVLAGKTASMQFDVDEDAFVLAGKSTRSDLSIQLQLLCAYLADPGWREEAQRVFREQIPALYAQVDHTMEGQMEARVEPFLRGGDPRFVFPEQPQLMARTSEETRAWLSPVLQKAPLEVAVVGDFELEPALAALAATFGALPTREQPDALARADQLKFPPPGRKDFTYESRIERALVAVHFPTSDRSDISRTRRLQVLASVFSDRLRERVREELGESYSPRASATASDVFPGYGYLFANVLVGPSQADNVASAIAAIAAGLVERGLEQDELDRALRPLINAITEQRRNNVYWLTTVCNTCQRDPRRIAWARTMLDDFTSVKKTDLEALARQFLAPDQAREIRILPVAPAAPPPTPTAEKPEPTPPPRPPTPARPVPAPAR